MAGAESLSQTDAETLAPLVKTTEQDVLSLMAAWCITGEAIVEALAKTVLMNQTIRIFSLRLEWK